MFYDRRLQVSLVSYFDVIHDGVTTISHTSLVTFLCFIIHLHAIIVISML